MTELLNFFIFSVNKSSVSVLISEGRKIPAEGPQPAKPSYIKKECIDYGQNKSGQGVSAETLHNQM